MTRRPGELSNICLQLLPPGACRLQLRTCRPALFPYQSGPGHSVTDTIQFILFCKKLLLASVRISWQAALPSPRAVVARVCSLFKFLLLNLGPQATAARIQQLEMSPGRPKCANLKDFDSCGVCCSTRMAPSASPCSMMQYLYHQRAETGYPLTIGRTAFLCTLEALALCGREQPNLLVHWFQETPQLCPSKPRHRW